MRHRSGAGAALIVFTALSGCGGGGGPSSTPAPPVATPAPSPAPAPTPTPAAAFDTGEYRRSGGPIVHNAIGGWQLGAAGQGVTIGIVDTGIDTTNPEFAGRISSASADVAGNRGIQAEDDHGTNVALVAAAARNGSGVVGMAFQSTILALRADRPGSCSTNGDTRGCRFEESAIAAGVDRATRNGAKVINLSLGGPEPDAGLRSAIARAAAADVLVVIAAGNDAGEPDTSRDSNSPAPFATGLRMAGNGNVIIAGSVDQAGTISTFSNRAGNEASWFLSALGERICCVYENGTLKTTVVDGQQFVLLFSGTSYATPQIAGAAALLREAFPNLTAAQTVDLLLRTAREAGPAGTDPTYGRGILDVGRAFAPQGATSIAGTTTQLRLGSDIGTTSPAMGDAGAVASLGTVVLDSYGRAYRIGIAPPRGAGAAPRLAGALIGQARDVAGGSPELTLAFSVDGRHRFAPSSLTLTRDEAASARVLAARMIARVGPQTRLGFAYAQSADGLVASLGGRTRPAFLLAGSPLNDSGFARHEEIAIAVRREWGAWGITVSGERGLVEDSASRPRGDRHAFGSARRFGLQIDRSRGPVDLAVGASWLDEEHTVLGGRFNPALAGSRGASSLFLDLDAGWQVDADWSLGASLRRGWTSPRRGAMLATGSRIVSQGWSLDVARGSVFSPGDSLAFRLSQPLRVQSGRLNLDLPTAYSYETLTAMRAIQSLSLVPRGRELIGEVAWRGWLWGGSASTSLYFRKNPGHHAALPPEGGAAFSWSTSF